MPPRHRQTLAGDGRAIVLSAREMTISNDCLIVGRGLLQLLTKAQVLLTHESFVRDTPDEYFYEVMEQAARLSSLCAGVLEARREHSSPVEGMSPRAPRVHNHTKLV